MNETKSNQVVTKVLNPMNGILALFLILLSHVLSVGMIIIGALNEWIPLILTGAFLFCLLFILYAGIRVVNPNEALVLTLFGNYYGNITKPGCFFINPFSTAFNPAQKSDTGVTVSTTTTAGGQSVQASTAVVNKKISTKMMTLSNHTQKVNDVLGNPIIIGAVVIWNVTDPTKAVFNVDNYNEYLSIQCDSIIRNTARLYPYDSMENDSDEKTLRGSSLEIAEAMKKELQEKVECAGLTIHEVRITHLSYSEEIAAAMLQRQQATAIIAARQKIVEGAVSMVKMAIDQLGEEEIVVLDEERKAAMVSNLLVVLCGNKDAQPVVNSGSIY